jgi:hypothetical protein
MSTWRRNSATPATSLTVRTRFAPGSSRALARGTSTADALLELADRGDLLEAVRTLDISLATVNSGLHALALAPLHNADGHVRQFAAYLQQHQWMLQDRVRDAFLPAYRAGESLDAYLRLRQLPDLRPDEAWLDLYWDIPEQVIADHVEAWFHQAVPETGHASDLPPVDDIRAANRRTLSRILSNAAPLVEAWLHRNAAGDGRRPADFTTVADAMTQAGVLDFERLTSSVVTRWLQTNLQWPVGMPLTTNRAELGLTDQDIVDARQRVDHAKDRQRRASTFVTLDGQTYSTDTDLVALADAVRAGITPRCSPHRPRSSPSTNPPARPWPVVGMEAPLAGPRASRSHPNP